MPRMGSLSREKTESRPSPVAVPLDVESPPSPGAGKVRTAIRQVFSFPTLLGGLLVTAVFALSRNGLADPDIWFHLLNAEHFLTTHKVPRVDTYSFTAAGLPWMNTEYLAEVPYYLAWRAFGLVGIKALSVLLLECIFLGLLYICWKESGNIKGAALACYFAAFLGTVTFGPRTILFGYGYMVVLLMVLQRVRLRGNGPLWLLPPLFCLWINTHGSWLLGLIVFALIIAGGLIDGKWGRIEAVRWSRPQRRKLLVTMGSCIVALFVNPYGYRLVFYPFDVAFRQRVAVAHVSEWVSVDFHTTLGKVVLILLVGLILAALLSEYRWKLHEVGLVLFALYTGLAHIRFLMLTAILIAPVLAQLLRFVPEYRREIDKPVLNGLLMIGMLVFMVRGFPSSAKLQESIDKDFPTDVLPYLRSQHLSGHILNSYLWGGYLCWNDRNFRGFIDSRADVFDHAGVFRDYIDFIGLDHPNRVLNKYQIRYVLFGAGDAVSELLRHDRNWKVIFSGPTSIMFEKTGGPPTVEARKPLLDEPVNAR